MNQKKLNMSSNTSNEIPSKAQKASNQRRNDALHLVFQQPASVLSLKYAYKIWRRSLEFRQRSWST